MKPVNSGECYSLGRSGNLLSLKANRLVHTLRRFTDTHLSFMKASVGETQIWACAA